MRNRVVLAIIVAALAVVLGVNGAGAAKPVKIDKSKTSYKEHRFAGTGCETGVVGPGGVIYEPACHRPLYTIGLQAFQVVAPRSASVHFGGVVNAQGCNRFVELDMKLVLLVDGQRIRVTELHVPRSKRPADFSVSRFAPITKGKHWVELGVQETEEEGLSGLCIHEATLSAVAP